MAENEDQHVRSNETSSTSTSTTRPKTEQRENVYDGIRDHERHILFHFFALFSISFFIGVFIIHLSLWVNANYFSSNDEVPISKPVPTYEDLDETQESGHEFVHYYFEPFRLPYDIINSTNVTNVFNRLLNVTS